MVTLRVINPKAKLHMDMLVPVDVLKAPALWVWGLGFYWMRVSFIDEAISVFGLSSNVMILLLIRFLCL